MGTKLLRATVLAAAVALLAVSPPLVAFAQDTGTETIDLEALATDRKEKAVKYPVASRISRYLNAAAKAVDDEDTAKAIELLDRLNVKRLNPYERALVYRLQAYIAYGSNEPATAIEYFEKFLAEEVMPIKDEAKVRFNIAQLHAQLQNWREVISWLNQWQRYTEKPDPLGYYLMAISYFQLQEFDPAIEYARKAIDASDEPREAWLRLLAALYSQNQDWANAGPVLEELVLRFPKKQYWVQLSLIYGAREDYRASLAVQQVAYLQGLLDEDKELRRLVRSYLYHELPYPAAKVLEQAIADGTVEADKDAYELLANSWIAAREYKRSYEPLRKAAERSADGNLYVRLGQVRMQSEAWQEAVGYLENGIAKGGLKNPGNAVLLLGIAYYNNGQVEQARAAFDRAQEFENTRAAALGWVTHIETEAAPSATDAETTAN